MGWASGSSAFVWKLDDPPDASPQLMRTTGSGELGAVAFEANARWAAAGSQNGVSLWSLASPHPRVLHGHTQELRSLAFTADSAYLASCARDGARLWPLASGGGRQHLISLGGDYFCYGISADSETQDLLVTAPLMGAFLVRPDGTAPRKLEGIPPTVLWGGALDTRARLVAVGVNFAPEAKDMVIHVADLRSGTVRTLATRDPADQNPFGGSVGSLGFAADGSLVSGGEGGVYRWDLSTGTRARLTGGSGQMSVVALNGRRDNMVAVTSKPRDPDSSEVLIIDPTKGTQRRVSSHGRRVSAVAMDASGKRIATGDSSGAVRVGWATGEEPHLLLGHRDSVSAVTFSPDGKWIASAGGTEIRLWPMPDLSKPPLHTLPHAELIAKLKSLGNLRAVRDAASAAGWKIELGPFPGWKNTPTW